MLALLTTDSLYLEDPIALKSRSDALKPSKLLSAPCTACTWSHQNTHLYIASRSLIHKYSPSDASLHLIYSSEDPITSLISKNTGNVLIFAAANKLYVLECTTERIVQTFQSHKTPIIAVSLSNDSGLLASITSSVAHVHNLSLSSPTILRGLSTAGKITACTFHPHTRNRLLLCVGMQMLVYDVTKPSGPVKSVQIPDSRTGQLIAVVCSPFSKTLVAVATSGGDIYLIDLDKEKGLVSVFFALFKTINVNTPLTSLAFTAEGAAIYLGTESGKLLILDLRTLDKTPKAISVSDKESRIENICVQRKLKPSGSDLKPIPIPEAKAARSPNMKARLASKPSHPTPDPEAAYLFGGAPRRPSANPKSPNIKSPVSINQRSTFGTNPRSPFDTNTRSTPHINVTPTRTHSSPALSRSKTGSIGAGIKSPARVVVPKKLQVGTETRVTPKKGVPKESVIHAEERDVFSPIQNMDGDAGSSKDKSPGSTNKFHGENRVPQSPNANATSRTRDAKRVASTSSDRRSALTTGRDRTRTTSMTSRSGATLTVPVSRTVSSASCRTSATSRPTSSASRVTSVTSRSTSSVSHSSKNKLNIREADDAGYDDGMLDVMDRIAKGKGKEKDVEDEIEWTQLAKRSKDDECQRQDKKRDEDEWKREQELSIQLSPRRPAAPTSNPPWLYPQISSANANNNPHANMHAHDLLRSIIQDVMYDFRQESRKDVMGLHLDIVRLGTGMRGLREEMSDMREENRRLRQENESLRYRIQRGG
ncbi:WD40-repeat-containing domain protein [Hygrophoropsis aurantiaca]|uniref:WD40-repeat-containing domain protein n=1 Tax=Hygrophoropsis aurantiaca TaxID=72124 RepID=A0ACB8AA09_9AGAM|nr:WD40-repeat-containing domain protein [Hygrophoropsis aurantiaca]